LQYADFLNPSAGHRYDWRLTNWSSAVRVTLGRRALFLFQGAFVVLLLPAAVLAVYGLFWNRPSLLIFVFLCLWGFWTGNTGPSVIGLAANLLVVLAGLLCTFILHEKQFILSAILPGITWFGSCAILGTTASYLIDALRASEDLFQTLVSRGYLTGTAIPEPRPPGCEKDLLE
jgi:hypothetical protein